jgi:glycosyltransferase involved in cell wall biosynthesis
MTYLNPRVDRIVCVAEAIREYLLNIGFLWLKIPPHKLVTIHKGHDLAWYRAAPHNLAEFGISENDFVAGCITNYRPRKGIEKIIEAAALLPRDLNIHFLLIGNMQHPRLSRLLERSPARDRVHLAGYRADAPQLQAACDACILPSLKREGLPKSVIEGMAYGLPAVVTDSGGSPELVEHGVSGLIVPPGSARAIAEAVTALRSDPERCRRMGIAARKRIEEHFSISVTIDKTYRLYRELAAGSGH